jgi:ABC-2 type transport system ATP-binding protein
MQDIEELCKRVILIDHGKIFFDGSLEDVVNQFTTTKIIEADFSMPLPDSFIPPGTVLELNPLQIKIEVVRVEVPQACTALLAGGMVVDLSVSEVPIEEVIRRVFGRQQEENKIQIQS